jgi:hypothetical protein
LRPGATIRLPYGPDLVWAVGLEGDVIHGITSTYRLVRMGLDGTTKAVYARDVAGEPVTGEEKQAQIKRLRNEMPRANVERSAIPDQKPFFSGLVIGSDGYVYVGRTPLEDAVGADVFPIDVFSPAGAFAGTIASPVPVGVWTWPAKVRGNFLVGMLQNADGLEFVRLIRLEPGYGN